MSGDNATTNLTVKVRVTSGVASALPFRFCKWQTTTPDFHEVLTHVPGANGAASVGILAEDITPQIGTLADGTYNSSMVKPDGSICPVLFGENYTIGAPIRVGGNSTEVDGAAYLADATGDVIVGYAMEAGSAGSIAPIQYFGFMGTAP